MEKQIFCLKDIKQSFQEPFYMANAEIAKRGLSFVVNGNEPNNALCLAPQDFELWYLGSFNDITGDIACAKEFICNLAELKRNSVGHVAEEVSDASENI